MIVSGFTQRDKFLTDEELNEIPGCHSHCIRCRKTHCDHPIDNITACAMTECHACGFRFHQCKGQEHALICQEEKAPCINALYGCPHLVKRSDMSTHLPVCPASVVTCGEEWSRWPMHKAEKGIHYPLPTNKTYLDSEQLDVAFALRDQRMLIDSLRGPKKLRNSLRNSLTQKYPAAPFVPRGRSQEQEAVDHESRSQTVSDDDTDAPWDLTRRPPGLKDNICRHIYQLSEKSSQELVTALKAAAISEEDSKKSVTVDANVSGNNSTPEELAKQLKTEALEKQMKTDTSVNKSVRKSASAERDDNRQRSRSKSVLRDEGGSQLHRVLGVKIGEEEDVKLHQVLGVDIEKDVINKYVPKPALIYNFICAQAFRRDQFKWHFKNVHEEILPQLNGYLESRCPLAYQGCTFSFRRLIPSQTDCELHFSPLLESFGLKSIIQPIHKVPSNDVSIDEKDFNKNESNNVDRKTYCHMPSISDLGDKDKDFFNEKTESSNSNDKMESESKTQESRPKSNEISSVSIQPMLYTGFNADSKVLLMYNMDETNHSTSCNSQFGLTQLPFEILQLIARRLDSFSLCNLSLTCQHLRDVCCSLLDDMGIVLFDWQRQKIGDKISWKVESKRWIFSTSFEPITQWKYNDNHLSITEHLKECPYNADKVDHTLAIQINFNELE